jgi:hypothetical protein
MILAKNRSSLRSSASDHTKAAGPAPGYEQIEAFAQPYGPQGVPDRDACELE